MTTKKATDKPAEQPAIDDQAEDATAEQSDAGAAAQVVLLEQLPSPGAPIVYEGLQALGHGRQGRRAYPAIIEAVANPDDPASAVELSYLYRGSWHYVASASFGREPGCWHWHAVLATPADEVAA